jgi:pimeloyl-ACP methyl ester carboxylesterase
VFSVIGTLVDVRQKCNGLWIGADIVVVALSGFFSIPSVEFRHIVGAAIAAAAVGFALDSLLIRSSQRVQTAVWGLPLVACMAIVLTKPLTAHHRFRLRLNVLHPNRILHLGLAPVHKGDRIVLETGAVAWLDRPSGQGSFPGALVFNGADPDGSGQPAAIILRHALLDAGFVVLSIDHPGFGESPPPSFDAEIDAWDPLPAVLAGFKVLRATPGIGGIFAFGHSMGSTDVIRLLSVESNLNGAAVFGAALVDPSKIDEYWYNRFHSDRRMHKYISHDQVVEITRRFYDIGSIVKNLPPDHAPLLFVKFGLEWPDIVATRDSLYEAIPGRKKNWDLINSTHHFNSHTVMGLIVGDTRITRLLASRLRFLISE